MGSVWLISSAPTALEQSRKSNKINVSRFHSICKTAAEGVGNEGSRGSAKKPASFPLPEKIQLQVVPNNSVTFKTCAYICSAPLSLLNHWCDAF